LQLAEARREADEYYKGGLRNNMRAMELSGKISQLTMDLASDTPWISSHVQVGFYAIRCQIHDVKKADRFGNTIVHCCL